ncbi:hypothetical protein IJU97_06045 [bacterium]|nr:hypothetical protein [bacterium]
MKKRITSCAKTLSSLDGMESSVKFNQLLLAIPVILWFIGPLHGLPKWSIYTALLLILYLQFSIDYIKYRLPRDIRDLIYELDSRISLAEDYKQNCICVIQEVEKTAEDELKKIPLVLLAFLFMVNHNDASKYPSKEDLIAMIKINADETNREIEEYKDLKDDAERLLQRTLKKLTKN